MKTHGDVVDNGSALACRCCFCYRQEENPPNPPFVSTVKIKIRPPCLRRHIKYLKNKTTKADQTAQKHVKYPKNKTTRAATARKRASA
mmetsp:Transcript_46129/g.55546  ORF Transcript_46129/g.55546 Transcript_46129/m.55546 type:complete len:88 (-) Transcript_46129:6-269(-)